MKTLKQNTFLIVTICQLFISCRKNLDTEKIASEQVNNSQTNDFSKTNNCLITHNQNQITGDVIDFFYKGDKLDSLNIEGLAAKIIYDKFGRPEKENFNNNTSASFRYIKYSFLPIALNFSVGGVIQRIDSFAYNLKGEMIKHIVTDATYYNSFQTEYYTYDKSGNIKKIDYAYNGLGTPYSYTEFIASKHDDKPNLMTGCVWTKFLLFKTLYEHTPFSWMLFSRNNIADWIWIRSPGQLAYTNFVKSTFEYDDFGFPIKIDMNLHQAGFPEYNGVYSQISSSSCDNSANSLQHFH